MTSFTGKFRRKKSNSSDSSNEHPTHSTHAHSSTSPMSSTPASDSISISDGIDVIEYPPPAPPPTSDYPHYEHEPSISSSVSSTQHVSFSIRNRRLLSLWRRIKRVRAIGILCALGSVVFWSSNGLFFKLNQVDYHIHALETLTVSSSIVSLIYLCFIFCFYGKRNLTTPTQSSSSTDVTGANPSATTSTTDISSTTPTPTPTNSKVNLEECSSVSSRDISQFTCDWSIILGVPGERISLILRCLLGTISLACFYSSYRYIPLGDATTIRFTSPVFIAIFAHFLVHEPFGLVQVVNSCTTLAGVILIGRPSFLFAGSGTSTDNSTSAMSSMMPFSSVPTMFRSTAGLNDSLVKRHPTLSSLNSTYIISAQAPALLSSGPSRIEPISSSLFHIYSNHFFLSNDSMVDPTTAPGYDQFKDTLVGVALALIASVTISISMIFMKKMKKTPAPLVIFWFSLSNVILGMIGLAVLREYRWPEGLGAWILFLATTLCSGLDQLFITLALKLENAGAVAVIQALCVVLSFVFSITILHEPLYWTSALGGSFIFLSVIVLGLAKMLEELRYASMSGKRKRKFKINLIQSFSSSSLSKKSKSFDILNQQYAKENDQSSPPATPAGTVSGKRGSFLYQNPINEPYLLRMAPISTDNIHYNNITTIPKRSNLETINPIDNNNNEHERF